MMTRQDATSEPTPRPHGKKLHDCEPNAPEPINRSWPRLIIRIGQTLIVALSLLSFPSVLPWMVAFWIACHTVLAQWKRPAWVPLLICLFILIAKMVPRTPAMLLLGLVLASVIAFRLKHRCMPQQISRWWITPAIAWVGWAFLLAQWHNIEMSSRSPSFHPMRPVVCIGDSLTEGLLPDHGFPEQLKEMIAVPVINLGFSGITSTQGLGQLDRVLSHDPQVVIIELGGHDFLKGHPRAQVKNNLVQMIQELRDHGAEVVLMEIPRGFMFDPFASVEREIAYELDVQLVADTWLRQIVILSPIAPPGKWMPQWRLSDDGIHSNTKGSRAIAKRVSESLRHLFGDEILSQSKSPTVPHK